MFNPIGGLPKTAQQIQENTNPNIAMLQNNSVENEEKETHKNEKIFFRALNLYKHYKKRLCFGKEKIAVRNITFGIES